MGNERKRNKKTARRVANRFFWLRGKGLNLRHPVYLFEAVVSVYDVAVRTVYDTVEGRVYLFTGSKSTGGFCVTRKGLLEPSRLGHILADTPILKDYTSKQGEFIKYKGRAYSWVDITEDGRIVLTDEMMSFLNIEPGMKLLSIRSSDIAFTMGAYGRLVEESLKHEDEIPMF